MGMETIDQKMDSDLEIRRKQKQEIIDNASEIGRLMKEKEEIEFLLKSEFFNPTDKFVDSSNPAKLNESGETKGQYYERRLQELNSEIEKFQNRSNELRKLLGLEEV